MGKIGEYSDYFLRDVSIGQKIRIICLVLVIIPVLVLGAIAYSSAYNAMFSDIKSNLEVQVSDMNDASATVYNLTQSKVDNDLTLLHYYFYAKGEPDIVNGNLVLGSGYKVNDNFEIVDEMQKIVGGAATIFQKKGDKAIRISTNVIGEDGKRAVGTSVSQAVYDVVINEGKTYYGTANVVGKKYITAYEPIKNKKGEIIGILFVGVDEDATIGVLKDQIKRKTIGKQGYMFVLNSTGYTLIHPTNEGKNDAQLPFIKEILDKKNGFIHYSYNGVDKVAAFRYYDKFDWVIIAGAALDDFTGPIDAIRNTIIIVIILGIIGGIAVSSWFSKSVTRRMNSLVELSRNVTAGTLTKSEVTFIGKDEIGLVGRAFADVIDTFEQFRDEIQRISKSATEGNLDIRGDSAKFQGDYAAIIQGVNNTVQAMAEPIQDAMRLCARYAKGDFSARMSEDLKVSGEFVIFRDALNTLGCDVSRSLAEVKGRVNELVDAVGIVDANVELVTGGIQHASKSISDVSEGTGQVAQIASAVSTLAEHSGENTRQILSAMDDLATTVTSVTAKMNQVTTLTETASELSTRGKIVSAKAEEGMVGILQSSSEIESMVTDISHQMGEIGRIVDIIGSIAEQTNLLALNAAIEAARAGEAGLGFAVVAGEVKELATGSQKSAENIAAIINTLQKKTELIAGAVNTSLNEVKTGNGAVIETLDIFNKIVESVTEINSNMNEVAAACEEQAASVEEVAASVHEFGEMINQTAKESIGLAAASEESSAAVDQIVTMIHEVNSSMDQISQQTTHARESARFIGEEINKFVI